MLLQNLCVAYSCVVVHVCVSGILSCIVYLKPSDILGHSVLYDGKNKQESAAIMVLNIKGSCETRDLIDSIACLMISFVAI